MRNILLTTILTLGVTSWAITGPDYIPGPGPDDYYNLPETYLLGGSATNIGCNVATVTLKSVEGKDITGTGSVNVGLNWPGKFDFGVDFTGSITISKSQEGCVSVEMQPCTWAKVKITKRGKKQGCTFTLDNGKIETRWYVEYWYVNRIYSGKMDKSCCPGLEQEDPIRNQNSAVTNPITTVKS